MISRKDFQQQPQRWPQNLWLQPQRSLKTASKLQRLLQFIPRDLRLECMVLGTIHILRKHIFRPFGPPPLFVIMIYVLKISKYCHFLTLPTSA